MILVCNNLLYKWFQLLSSDNQPIYQKIVITGHRRLIFVFYVITNGINGYDNHGRYCSIDLCIGSRLGHVKVWFAEMLYNFSIE